MGRAQKLRRTGRKGGILPCVCQVSVLNASKTAPERCKLGAGKGTPTGNNWRKSVESHRLGKIRLVPAGVSNFAVCVFSSFNACNMFHMPAAIYLKPVNFTYSATIQLTVQMPRRRFGAHVEGGACG